MCTGKCAKCIAVVLYPLAAVSIICNIILFFPDWDTKYAAMDGENDVQTLTPEVKYMGGVLGGGLMVLIPAIHIHLTGKQGCCANRCGMFLSIGFAAAGVVGAIWSMSAAALGLSKGPVCNVLGLGWGRPFDKGNNSDGNYLTNPESWDICVEPKDVVEFNVALFAVLLAVAAMELVLCGFQMVNGLFGCICGTCNGKE